MEGYVLCGIQWGVGGLQLTVTQSAWLHIACSRLRHWRRDDGGLGPRSPTAAVENFSKRQFGCREED